MRIASFNVENLDDAPPRRSGDPSFEERAAVLRPMLERLRADVLCLQEVHGQNDPAEEAPAGRTLRALTRLLQGTRYARHLVAHTHLAGRREPERFRNLVTLIPPAWGFVAAREVKHEFAPPPAYAVVTDEAEDAARPVVWERPMLYTEIETEAGLRLHVLNCHFKSKNPTRIADQGPDNFRWRTAAGWAEGFFLSSMKRVGAALEARMMLDTLFAADREARIVLCGDLNAESHEVPVLAVRGRVEDHGNAELNHQEMFPCESSVPEDSRFTLYHHGRRNMLDHLLVSRAMLGAYRGTEIHNELTRDESIAFAVDAKFPQPDHAPVVAEFDDALMGPGA